MNRLVAAFCILPCSLLAAPGFALDQQLGFSLGSAQYDTDSSGFDDGSLSNASVDTRAAGGSFIGELLFNPHFRFEYGFFEGLGGSYRGTSDGSGSYYPAGPVHGDFNIGGIKVGVVGVIPLGTPRFKVFAKGGLIHWFGTVTYDNSSWGDEMEIDQGVAPQYGFGFELDINTRIALRLQLEQFSATMENKILNKDLDIDYRLTSLGMMFRF